MVGLVAGTTGVSTLWPVWSGDGLEVRQESPTPRTALIGVGRYDRVDGRLRRRDVTEVEVSGERTPVPLAGPRPDLLLLNDGDLAFAKVRFDDRSAGTLTGSLHTLDDELSRAVCWSALWDATRDAELPAGAFLDAVLAGAALESDPQQVRVLLGQAVTAAGRYTPPDRQGEALRRLADFCWTAAHSAAPGGDLQLVRSRAFVAAAADERIDGLLAGAAPAGLVLDTDLRWHIVRRLAALGRADTDRLDAELARDRTAAGERQHAAAVTAIPDAEVKQRAFASLTEQDELANDLVRAVADAFWQRGQEELCRPWVPRYFAALPALWAGRGPEVSRAVTQLLYPRLDEPEVLASTDEFLRQPDLPAGCRRLVLEQRDDLARAVRAASAGEG